LTRTGPNDFHVLNIELRLVPLESQVVNTVFHSSDVAACGFGFSDLMNDDCIVLQTEAATRIADIPVGLCLCFQSGKRRKSKEEKKT